MTQKEKAIAYDKALERAKEKYAMFEGMKQGDVLEDVFPELKESEDEKVEKAILGMVYDSDNELWGGYDVSKSDVLAWLEKQGERKPFDYENANIQQKDFASIEPKFKVGDKIIEKDFDECGCGTIIDIKDGKYIFDDGGFISIEEQGLWELVEQKLAWSEEDDALLYGVIETEQYMLDVVTGLKTFDVGNEQIESQCAKELEWLKTLKERIQPQNTWNPSEHELEVLKLVAEKDGTCLMGLYKQLKKLKEE